MASLNEIAINIADNLGQPFDHMLIERIKFNVIHYRAMFIRRDQDRNNHISPILQQDLGCIPLEEVDAAECCDIESNCTVLRTKYKLPTPIRLKGNSDFIYVGDITKTGPIDLVEPDSLKYLNAGRYSKLGRYYYYLNDRIYLINTELDYVNVRGVFVDPREVAAFNQCEGADCYTDDSKFPIADDMIEGITMGLLNGQFRLIQGSDNKEIKFDV
jgi:hypothetical protein